MPAQSIYIHRPLRSSELNRIELSNEVESSFLRERGYPLANVNVKRLFYIPVKSGGR